VPRIASAQTADDAKRGKERGKPCQGIVPGVSGDFAWLSPGTNTLTARRGAFTAVVNWRRRYS